MAFDKDAIIASLKEASISDLNDLVKAIEEEFDVSAAAPVAVAGAAGADAAAKDSFTVELTSAGSAKVKVIKVVKDITGLGLKDAKEKSLKPLVLLLPLSSLSPTRKKATTLAWPSFFALDEFTRYNLAGDEKECVPNDLEKRFK